jgi:hypothetical protein
MIAVPIAIAILLPRTMPLPAAALFQPSLLLLPRDCLRPRGVPLLWPLGLSGLLLRGVPLLWLPSLLGLRLLRLLRLSLLGPLLLGLLWLSLLGLLLLGLLRPLLLRLLLGLLWLSLLGLLLLGLLWLSLLRPLLLRLLSGLLLLLLCVLCRLLVRLCLRALLLCGWPRSLLWLILLLRLALFFLLVLRVRRDTCTEK